jgi:hypothetical protein
MPGTISVSCPSRRRHPDRTPTADAHRSVHAGAGASDQLRGAVALPPKQVRAYDTSTRSLLVRSERRRYLRGDAPFIGKGSTRNRACSPEAARRRGGEAARRRGGEAARLGQRVREASGSANAVRGAPPDRGFAAESLAVVSTRRRSADGGAEREVGRVRHGRQERASGPTRGAGDAHRRSWVRCRISSSFPGAGRSYARRPSCT